MNFDGMFIHLQTQYHNVSDRRTGTVAYSKALRGPGSTVTWGPPFPSPPLPLPPLPLSLSLIFPSPAPPPAAKRPPNPARGSGEHCKLPQRGLGRTAESQPKSNLVQFSLKIRHMVATILMVVLRSCLKFFCGPTTRGLQELGGPGSLNRPNPRFLRH